MSPAPTTFGQANVRSLFDTYGLTATLLGPYIPIPYESATATISTLNLILWYLDLADLIALLYIFCPPLTGIGDGGVVQFQLCLR